jgi:hypothetical protein
MSVCMKSGGESQVVGKVERIECASIIFPLDRQMGPIEHARQASCDAGRQESTRWGG